MHADVMKVWKICVLAALLLIIGGAVYLGFCLFGQTAVDLVEVADTTGMTLKRQRRARLESLQASP